MEMRQWACCHRDATIADSAFTVVDAEVPGCAVSERHVFQLKLLIIGTSKNIQKLTIPSYFELELLEPDENLTDLESALSNFSEYDMIVVLSSASDSIDLQELLLRHTSTNPNLRLIVFSSDPSTLAVHTESEFYEDEYFEEAVLRCFRSYVGRNFLTSPEYFVSYTRNNQFIVDDILHNYLPYHNGVWKDTNYLVAGQVWSSAIEEAIKLSNVFLLVLTASTDLNSYCYLELEIALREKRPILIIQVGSVDTSRISESIINLNTYEVRKRGFWSFLGGERTKIYHDKKNNVYLLKFLKIGSYNDIPGIGEDFARELVKGCASGLVIQELRKQMREFVFRKTWL